MKQRCITLGMMVFIAVVTTSWIEGQTGILQGMIVDSVSGSAVEYVQVLNYSLQQQIYSNSKGEFRLRARQGDTLVMYATGYYYHKFIVKETMLTGEAVTFALKQQPYELSTAQILGIDSYDQFRHKLVTAEIPKTRTEQLNESLGIVTKNVAIEAYNDAMAARKMQNGGVTLLSVPIYTPEERERMKLAKIIKKEQVRDQIYQKFNPVMVKEITGLSDDNEIIGFMQFCDFKDSYLLEVNEYDLSARIALKFELFKRQKEDERRMKNPLNFIDELINVFV